MPMASSWACSLLRATCLAITRCLSAIRMHLLHSHLANLQKRLWPLTAFSSTSPSVATSLFNPSLCYPYIQPYSYYAHPQTTSGASSTAHHMLEPFLPHHSTVYCYPPPNTPSYSSGSPAAVITPGFASPGRQAEGLGSGESRGGSPVDYKDDSDKEGERGTPSTTPGSQQQQLVSINPLVNMAALQHHHRRSRGHPRYNLPIYDIPFQDRRETAANA